MDLLESVKVRDALGIDLCTAVRAFRVCILIAIPKNGYLRLAMHHSVSHQGDLT